MSSYPCKCCGHTAESDERRTNFYREHFIPTGWKLTYFQLSDLRELILTGHCCVCHGRLEEHIPLPDGLVGDDLLKAVYDTMQSAHPYDKHDERLGYYGKRKERSEFYRRRDEKPQSDRSKEFLDLFHDYDRAQVRGWLERNFPPQSHSDVLRDTGGDLFSTVVRMARAAGDFDKADAILDYILPREDEPEIYEGVKLTAYEFDFLATPNFGGSEGIYVDCYLRGKFDKSGRFSLHVGTLKTLDTSLEACKIMGELCGVLMHYANQYVNRNLHRYTPDKVLKEEDKSREEGDHPL